MTADITGPLVESLIVSVLVCFCKCYFIFSCPSIESRQDESRGIPWVTHIADTALIRGDIRHLINKYRWYRSCLIPTYVIELWPSERPVGSHGNNTHVIALFGLLLQVIDSINFLQHQHHLRTSCAMVDPYVLNNTSPALFPMY